MVARKWPLKFALNLKFCQDFGCLPTLTAGLIKTRTECGSFLCRRNTCRDKSRDDKSSCYKDINEQMLCVFNSERTHDVVRVSVAPFSDRIAPIAPDSEGLMSRFRKLLLKISTCAKFLPGFIPILAL